MGWSVKEFSSSQVKDSSAIITSKRTLLQEYYSRRSWHSLHKGTCRPCWRKLRSTLNYPQLQFPMSSEWSWSDAKTDFFSLRFSLGDSLMWLSLQSLIWSCQLSGQS